MRGRLSLLLGLSVLLAACGASLPASGTQADLLSSQAVPRPSGAPDVLILGVSGRCGVGNCSAPGDNWNYLEPRGTLEALASSFRALGKTVQVQGYSATLSTHFSRESGRNELGFLQLEAKLNEARSSWIEGVSNPTKLVLVGHSHGTNWTHNLVRIYPGVQFDYLIDLDGICTLWESDHRTPIGNYYSSLGRNPWPLDIRSSCDTQAVSGTFKKYNVKDVAYPNVRFNVEVQSKRLFGLSSEGGLSAQSNLLPQNELAPQGDLTSPYDFTSNVRLNGSRSNIFTFVSRDESHNEVYAPSSAAISWVKGRIAALGL